MRDIKRGNDDRASKGREAANITTMSSTAVETRFVGRVDEEGVRRERGFLKEEERG